MDMAKERDLARSLLRSPVPWFLVLSVFLLWAHEPWRDEAEVWLIGRDSPSLAAFFQTMRYEGTPPVWHLLLMGLAKLGFPFMAARVLHVLVATAGVAVVWLHAPFSRLEKWLWAFGYYTAYEYDALTRSYALLCLVLFIIAAVDLRRHARPILYAGLLALLANITLHGFLIAGVLAAAFGIETLRRKAWTPEITRGTLVVVAGLAVAAFLMRPPPDLAPWLKEWFLAQPHTYNGARSIIQAFIPVPSGELVFWNSNVFDTLTGSGKMVVATLLFAAACLTLRRDLRVLGIFLACTAVLEVLFVLKYYGGAHHAGLVFTLYLVCLWLARARIQGAANSTGLRQDPVPGGRTVARMSALALAWFVPAILLLQVVATAVAVERDATGEFSAAGDVAKYLEDQGLMGNGSFVTVYHSHSGMAILAQLDDPAARFYFTEYGRMGSSTPWTAQWQNGTHFTLDRVLAGIDAAAPPIGRLILIDDAPHFDGSRAAWSRLHLLASFGDRLVGTREEQFDVFEVARAA